MEETVFIYELIDPVTQQTRYIGKSNNLHRREIEHINDKSINHRTNWINKLKRQRLKPILNVIDIVPKSEWEFWEMWWIEVYLSWGISLTNRTKGGDCGPIRKGKDNYMFERTHSSDARLKISISKKKLVGELSPRFGLVSNLKGKTYEEIVGAEKAMVLREQKSLGMIEWKSTHFPLYEITNHNSGEVFYNDCGLQKYCAQQGFSYWTLFYGVNKGLLNNKRQRFHINWSIKTI